MLAALSTNLYAVENLIEPPMILIPAGNFLMGSDKGKKNELPVHQVNINKFMVGKYEITVKEFRQFIKATGFKRTDDGFDSCWMWDSKEYMKQVKGNWDNDFNAPSDFHPVMCISADQAQAYVDWLAKSTGKPYRLITEAEWEYVSKAGSKSLYFFGDNAADLCRYGNTFDERGKRALARDFKLNGNFNYAKCDDRSEYTSIIGMYQPNAFGLYDTIGNVNELVQDCEHNNYINAPTNGTAWIDNCDLFREKYTMLISRGGAYGLFASPKKVRSTNREHFGAGNGDGSSLGEGFRIALDLSEGEMYKKASSTIKFEQELIKAQKIERVRRGKMQSLEQL